MFCVDSSSLVAFLDGSSGEDVEMLESAIASRSVTLPPPVLSEILSNPKLTGAQRSLLSKLPTLPLSNGFWERAGLTRADLLDRKFKPKLADTLIAQSCIDANRPLIARDSDFAPFAKHSGLRLLP